MDTCFFIVVVELGETLYKLSNHVSVQRVRLTSFGEERLPSRHFVLQVLSDGPGKTLITGRQELLTKPMHRGAQSLWFTGSLRSVTLTRISRCFLGTMGLGLSCMCLSATVLANTVPARKSFQRLTCIPGNLSIP